MILWGDSFIQNKNLKDEFIVYYKIRIAKWILL